MLLNLPTRERAGYHPSLVMYNLPSPSHSPNPPRLNNDICTYLHTAPLRWSCRMAAVVKHIGEPFPPILRLPFLLASTKDCNCHLHPPRSFPTTPSVSCDYGPTGCSTGRAFGESYCQRLQTGSTPRRE